MNKFWKDRKLASWLVLYLIFPFHPFFSICEALAQETPAQGVEASAPALRQITLKMGSWRPDDISRMNEILELFHKEHQGLRIRFYPIEAPEYDAVLESQMEEGTGPDLLYLRSFGVSRNLFQKGYLESLNSLPGLKENFDPAMLAPWTTEGGRTYGVPFTAVSHGVYYNQDIFQELSLTVPRTWEEFLETCQKIKDAGRVPLANASGDAWTINEIVFFNLAPNFIGGRKGRMAYLAGERCFNDENMVAALQAVADLAPFLPERQELRKYTDSLQLFLQGSAAMWMSGSWDIPFFEKEKPQFQWDVFAPPPPQGKPPQICFHLDAGMGLNAASKNKEAARLFLQWIARPEFGCLLGNHLPGFFPLHKKVPVLDNYHANQFLCLNHGRGTDIRLAWEKLRDGQPDGYDLMQEASVDVINGKKTPRQAADFIQEGLAQWFAPAKRCGIWSPFSNSRPKPKG